MGCLLDTFNEFLEKRSPPPVLYAHNMDMPGLRITRDVTMDKLESFINFLPVGRHVGIVCPTVYIGSEFSTFNAHREDMSAEGMNTHIAGAEKVWCVFVTADEYACTSVLFIYVNST